MEILIIGGILVIVMVIVSTKIKKNAAAAYEPEFVKNDDFEIHKPEGFLYPLREIPDFPFEAYSKLYGDKITRNIWRARVRLRISDGKKLDELVTHAKKEEDFISEKVFDDIPENQRGIILRTGKIEDEIEYKLFRKIIEDSKENKTYELRTTHLEPYSQEYVDRTCEMMASFVVK